jgi:hypothetical protein
MFWRQSKGEMRIFLGGSDNVYACLWCCLSFSSLALYSFFFFFLVFRDRVSLYSPGCPGPHFLDQAGLELRNPPASASRVLGLKACATDLYCAAATVYLFCSLFLVCTIPTTKPALTECSVSRSCCFLNRHCQFF